MGPPRFVKSLIDEVASPRQAGQTAQIRPGL